MSTTPTIDGKTAILSANNEFMAAFKRRDAAAIGGLYTTGGQVLPPQSDAISGPDAISQFWAGVFSLGIEQVVLQTVDVEMSSDGAIETGRYTLLAQGGVTVDRGKYLVVWRQEGGRLKLHRDIWNTSQPAA